MADEWVTASSGEQEQQEFWDRKEPLEGTYVSKRKSKGKFGEQNVYVVKTGDKKVAVGATAIIDQSFEEIPLGSQVRLAKTGTAPSDKGNDVILFDIKYKKPAVSSGTEEVDDIL